MLSLLLLQLGPQWFRSRIGSQNHNRDRSPIRLRKAKIRTAAHNVLSLGDSYSTERCATLQWALFRNPRPVQLVWEVLAVDLRFVPQYAPPICNAVPCWLLNFGERETPQYTSNLYRRYASIPANRLPFVPAILLRKYRGWGFRKAPDSMHVGSWHWQILETLCSEDFCEPPAH